MKQEVQFLASGIMKRKGNKVIIYFKKMFTNVNTLSMKKFLNQSEISEDRNLPPVPSNQTKRGKK